MQSFKDTEIIKMALGIIRVFNINYKLVHQAPFPSISG